MNEAVSEDSQGGEARQARRAICGMLLFGILLAICFSVGGVWTVNAAESLVNRKAPLFVRRDLNNKILNLKNFRGKVVLLNFWATWCAPCQIEMPVFVEWQRKYGSQGFQVIGISMDDGAAPVRGLVRKLKLNYPIAMGDEKLGARYGRVLGLPMTYLIDRDGKVRAQFQGETNLMTIEEQLLPLLSHP